MQPPGPVTEGPADGKSGAGPATTPAAGSPTGAATAAEATPIPGPGLLTADTPGLKGFALLLAALIFAAFPQVVLGLETFIVRDYGFFAYPLAHLQREYFWGGQLPLWNPFNDCGVPFLAQWNTMPLYPPSLVYLLLPLPWSLSFFCLLHLFWAGLGMYLLARRWTGSQLGAGLAGVSFAFNGFTLNLLMWPSHIATISWMPWVLLCAERGWRVGGRQLLLAAAVGALQMLAGGPETILFTWVLAVALWATQLWQTRADRGALLSIAARFPIIVVLVAGLAAAQILPFLDFASHSQRETGFADTRWSLPGWGWANFLVPMVFGHRWSKGLFFQYEQAWTSSYYLGIAPLLLAVLALWQLRQTRVRLLVVASVVALLLAFGDQVILVRWLRDVVPQLSLITYPVKYLTVVVLGVPLLAAFALARLRSAADRAEVHRDGPVGAPSAASPSSRPTEEGDPHSKPLPRSGYSPAGPVMSARLMFIAGVFLILIAGILLWAWRSPFPTDDFHNTLVNGLTRLLFLLGTVVLLWRMALPASCRRRREESSVGGAQTRGTPHVVPYKPTDLSRLSAFLPLSLLVLVWLDVWTHEPSQNPTVPNLVYIQDLARISLGMRPQPELGQSRAMISPAADAKFRQFLLSDFKDNFLVKRRGYFADCNLLDDVPKVDGFFSIYPRQIGELMSALYTSTNAVPDRLLDFLAVSQVTAPGHFFDWQRRPTCLPLATAGQKPVFLDDPHALSAWFNPQFDPRRFVVLPPDCRPLVSVTNQTQASLTFDSKISNQNSRMIPDLEVQASEPSLVVLSQTYYHCWRAYLDGKPIPLWRANYAFQAVQVPAGTHHLELRYEDRAFQVGLLISLMTLLACALLWLVRQSNLANPESSHHSE